MSDPCDGNSNRPAPPQGWGKPQPTSPINRLSTEVECGFIQHVGDPLRSPGRGWEANFDHPSLDAYALNTHHPTRCR